MPDGPRRPGIATLLFLLTLGSAALGASDLGSTLRPEGGAFIGILYDLKQTQRREPVPRFAQGFAHAIDDFLVACLDEALLNRYFRAPLPLDATRFAIRPMHASSAPRAFGVADVIKAQLLDHPLQGTGLAALRWHLSPRG